MTALCRKRKSDSFSWAKGTVVPTPSIRFAVALAPRRKNFSDKFGHENCAILRENGRVAILPVRR